MRNLRQETQEKKLETRYLTRDTRGKILEISKYISTRNSRRDTRDEILDIRNTYLWSRCNNNRDHDHIKSNINSMDRPKIKEQTEYT